MLWPPPLWNLFALLACRAVVPGALAPDVRHMEVIMKVAARGTDRTQRHMRDTVFVVLLIGSAQHAVQRFQVHPQVTYSWLVISAALRSVCVYPASITRRPQSDALLLEILPLAVIAILAPLRGGARVSLNATITDPDRNVLGTSPPLKFAAALPPRFSISARDALGCSALAARRTVAIILEDYVASAAMLATSVTPACHHPTVIAEGAWLVAPAHVQDLRISMMGTGVACPAREPKSNSLPPHPPGTLSFLASPLLNP